MDISRLPPVPLARPASATHRATPHTRTVEVVEQVQAPHKASRTGEHAERVVQGELLERERAAAAYQSTRAFITERALDHALPSERQAHGARQSRIAVSNYLNNTRPESNADLTQGRSVNFFV